AVDRRAAVPEHKRRPGAGIPRGWHSPGHHCSAVEIARAVRDRPQLDLHLQGACGRFEAAGSRIGRPLHSRRLGAQGGQSATSDAAVGRGGDPGQIWAERYDRDIADIFAVQDEITATVSAAILPAVERSERERAMRKPLDSLDAWECYHRGLWHYAKAEAAENALALRFFERAIALDPGFAAAHAALSFTLQTQASGFGPQSARPTLLPRAAEHARRAIALDPADALGHASLSRALVHMGRHEEGIAEADLAAQLAPNSAR